MKNKILLLLLIVPVLFTACKDDETSELSTNEKKAITLSIKDQVLSSFSGIMSQSQTRSASLLRSTETESMIIPSETFYGPEGGSIVMSGSYTISMTTNDSTSEIEDMGFEFNMTDTYNNYTYTYDGIKITLNGALNIVATCQMNALSGAFEYNMTLTGTVKAKTSNGYDDSIDFNVVYTIYEDGHGTATGTVGGEAYYESF